MGVRMGGTCDVGQDPATDLRGVGMLGLLHLLYFVTKHREMALAVYTLSRDARQVRKQHPKVSTVPRWGGMV